MPIVVDHFNHFPISSNSRQSIDKFGIFAVDWNDELCVHFVDSQTQGKIVEEKVDSDSKEDNQEQEVKVACKYDVNIDDSNDV